MMVLPWWMRRAGMQISSARRRGPWRRPWSSMPVTACSSTEMLIASSAAHIHTVLSSGFPEGR